MSEAGIEIFWAAIGFLAIVTAIQFAERAHRYSRLREKKPAGTYGFEYEASQSQSS